MPCQTRLALLDNYANAVEALSARVSEIRIPFDEQLSREEFDSVWSNVHDALAVVSHHKALFADHVRQHNCRPGGGAKLLWRGRRPTLPNKVSYAQTDPLPHY